MSETEKVILQKLIPLVLLLSAAQEPTFSLRSTPKEGAETTLTTHFTLEANEVNMEMNMDMFFKILKVAEDGTYDMESTTLSGTMKVNGEEEAIPKGDPEVTKYDKDGHEIKEANAEEEEFTDPIGDVFDIATEFEPKEAVKIGGTWEIKSKYGTLKGTLVGKEKIGEIECLKLAVEGALSEKGASGEVKGTVLLHEKDFELESLEYDFSRVKLDAEMDEAKIKIKISQKRG